MYRSLADYSVLEGVALWLARAVLNPCGIGDEDW